jgi:hypothetical protein
MGGGSRATSEEELGSKIIFYNFINLFLFFYNKLQNIIPCQGSNNPQGPLGILMAP